MNRSRLAAFAAAATALFLPLVALAEEAAEAAAPAGDWQASLDTLSFLPLDTADPFAGVILTGWGSVAGGGSYRVTVLIDDPALDASSLKVAAFRQQGGRAVPVSDAENNQLEDAILTRARQLRIADSERRN